MTLRECRTHIPRIPEVAGSGQWWEEDSERVETDVDIPIESDTEVALFDVQPGTNRVFGFMGFMVAGVGNFDDEGPSGWRADVHCYIGRAQQADTGELYMIDGEFSVFGITGEGLSEMEEGDVGGTTIEGRPENDTEETMQMHIVGTLHILEPSFPIEPPGG